MHLLEEEISLVKNNKHTIEVVVDRIRLREDVRRRLSDSLETALKLSGGLVIVQDADSGKEMLFSENYACPDWRHQHRGNLSAHVLLPTAPSVPARIARVSGSS